MIPRPEVCFTLWELYNWNGDKEPIPDIMKLKNTIIAEWRGTHLLRYFWSSCLEDVFVILPDGKKEWIASFDEED
jgi:hypothetical protein